MWAYMSAVLSSYICLARYIKSAISPAIWLRLIAAGIPCDKKSYVWLEQGFNLEHFWAGYRMACMSAVLSSYSCLAPYPMSTISTQGLVTTYLSSKNFDLPYTIIIPKGESTGKILHTPSFLSPLFNLFRGDTSPPTYHLICKWP